MRNTPGFASVFGEKSQLCSWFSRLWIHFGKVKLSLMSVLGVKAQTASVFREWKSFFWGIKLLWLLLTAVDRWWTGFWCSSTYLQGGERGQSRTSRQFNFNQWEGSWGSGPDSGQQLFSCFPHLAVTQSQNGATGCSTKASKHISQPVLVGMPL